MANPIVRFVVAAHVWLYKRQRARTMNGQQLVLLTTKGNKSGQPRTVPVMSFEDGGDRVVVASMGGQPENPAWFKNLVADPNVTVQIGEEKHKARAIVTEPAERDRLWTMIVATAPQFGGYEKKTTRVIPVVRLKRA